MKKHFIISSLLSVTLIAVTLPHVSANVVADREIIVENSIHENNNEEEISKNEDIPMTAILPSRTITYDSVKTEESIANESNNQIYSRGSNVVEEVEFTISFYTSLPKENGGHTVTCKGIPLKGLEDVVANNVYPLHTKIYLDKYGEVTVLDTGGKDFNNSNRLDMLIQREIKSNGKWENDDEYERRVNKMGHVKVKGWILK
jgi:3D (Asp-Asp-Asp) domain-containing protein